MSWKLICIRCGLEWPTQEVRYRCACGGTLDVVLGDGSKLSFEEADRRLMSRGSVDRSGVWRFREWVLPLPSEHIVTKPEGNTNLYSSRRVASYVGLDEVWMKHEGENPTGSFKDRGMTAGVSAARWLGMERVACASTGNTSASMAAYAAQAGMKAFVFVPAGQIAYGKLSQALAYGATTLQIAGDFDDAMRLVEQVSASEGIYLLNSVNPYRIEGQKSIAFEILQDRQWSVPDWIVLPGGNLGNNAAISKGFMELYQAGRIPRLPRIAVVQAEGANPLYRAWTTGRPLQPMRAETLATAIRIGDPVSFDRSMRGLNALNGVVVSVDDAQILDAKAEVDAAGIGAEPASCASIAGLKALVRDGVIGVGQQVVAVLTGHLLKDPDSVVKYHRSEWPGVQCRLANRPRSVGATLPEVLAAIRES